MCSVVELPLQIALCLTLLRDEKPRANLHQAMIDNVGMLSLLRLDDCAYWSKTEGLDGLVGRVKSFASVS